MDRIVFLNLAVMPYQVAVFRELVKMQYELHVFWYAKAPKTSYRAPKIEHVTQYNRFDYRISTDLIKMVDTFSPKMIVCGGWTDSVYNKTALYFKKKGIPTVVMSDTQWRGGKQWYNVLTSPFRMKRYFSHFFAAGILQFDYARKLGFSTEKILLHSLTGDIDLFKSVDITKKRDDYPRRILYVGRFVEVKALDILIDAWNRIEDKKGWVLELVGEGPLKSKIEESSNVVIKDFMSQEELVKEAQNSGCFILPSRFEPWALVIHEFAAAGLPLLCSSYCGAVRHFLINGYNGFEFNPNDIDTVVKSISRILNMSIDELILMSERSRELSQRITPEIVATTLLGIVNN